MKKNNRLLASLLSAAILSSAIYIPSCLAYDFEETSPGIWKEDGYYNSVKAYDVSIEDYIIQNYGENTLKRVRKIKDVCRYADEEGVICIDDNGVLHRIYTEKITVVKMKPGCVPPADKILSEIQLYKDGKCKAWPLFTNMYNMDEDTYRFPFSEDSEEYAIVKNDENVLSIEEMTLVNERIIEWIPSIAVCDGITSDEFYREYKDSLKLIDHRVLRYWYDTPICEIDPEYTKLEGFDTLYYLFDDKTEALEALKKIFESDITFKFLSIHVNTGMYPDEPTDENLAKLEYNDEQKISDVIRNTNETKLLFERSEMFAEGKLTLEDIKAEREEQHRQILLSQGVTEDDQNLNNYTSSNVVYGDLNSDNRVDVTDLSELSLALADGKEFTDAQQNAADVDGDGKVTLSDLARMRQFLSKLITSF